MSIYFLRTPDNIHSKVRNLKDGDWTDEKSISYDNNIEEVTSDYAISGCRIYRTPLLEYTPDSLKLEKKYKTNPVPDIIEMHSRVDALLVSEKCKEVIEAHDDFGHQFTSMNLFDHQGNLQQERNLYWCNIRRHIEFEENGIDPTGPILFDSGSHSIAISNIQNNQKLSEDISSFPIWRSIDHSYVTNRNGDQIAVYHFGTLGLFINEQLYLAMQAAGLTGIKEIKGRNAKSTEHIYHV